MLYKGKWIGVPFDGDTLVLIYRRDYMEDPKEKAAFKAKYGYELAPPKTGDQYNDIAEFFTRPDDNLYGLSAAGARGVVAAQEFMTYLKMFGGSILDADGNVTLDDPIAVEALEFFVRTFDELLPVLFW